MVWDLSRLYLKSQWLNVISDWTYFILLQWRNFWKKPSVIGSKRFKWWEIDCVLLPVLIFYQNEWDFYCVEHELLFSVLSIPICWMSDTGSCFWWFVIRILVLCCFMLIELLILIQDWWGADTRRCRRWSTRVALHSWWSHK